MSIPLNVCFVSSNRLQAWLGRHNPMQIQQNSWRQIRQVCRNWTYFIVTNTIILIQIYLPCDYSHRSSQCWNCTVDMVLHFRWSIFVTLYHPNFSIGLDESTKPVHANIPYNQNKNHSHSCMTMACCWLCVPFFWRHADSQLMGTIVLHCCAANRKKNYNQCIWMNQNLYIYYTKTKSVDIDRWYLLITSGSLINMTTFSSSTNIPQFASRHTIDWLIPSSTIFCVRYRLQHPLQNLWPHSKPYIFWNFIKRKNELPMKQAKWNFNHKMCMYRLHRLYHSICYNRLNRCRNHLPAAMEQMDSLPLLL